MSLNFFDFIVLFIMGYSTLMAFLKGFVKASISTMGWILSFVGCYLLSPYASILLSDFISNQFFVSIAANFVSYIVSLVLVVLFNSKLTDLTVNLRGGALDRSLGVAFGFVRGCILVSFLFFIVTAVSPLFVKKKFDDPADFKPLPTWLKKAESYYLLRQGNNLLLSFLPNKVASFNLDDKSLKMMSGSKNPQVEELHRQLGKEKVQTFADEMQHKKDLLQAIKIYQEQITGKEFDEYSISNLNMGELEQIYEQSKEKAAKLKQQ